MLDTNKYLSRDDVALLLESVHDDLGSPDGIVRMLVVEISLGTGLRVCEMASLTVGDVDLRRRLVAVRRAKKRDARSDDHIALSRRLAAVLRASIPADAKPTDPLIRGQRGPLTKRGWQQAWDRACAIACLADPPSIHGARHTLAVELLRTCKNLRVVQVHLGHSNIETTSKQYAHVPWDDRLEAIDGTYQGASK